MAQLKPISEIEAEAAEAEALWRKNEAELHEKAALQVDEERRVAANDKTKDGRRVLDPTAPLRIAQRLHDDLFPTAIHTNGDWLEYDAGAYRDDEDATIRSAVYRALDEAVVRSDDGKEAATFKPFKPDSTKVNKVLDALKSHAHVPAKRIVPPAWLREPGQPANEIISCRNGLLHVPTGELLPPTPNFFTRNALDIDYAPDAPPPDEWLRFMAGTFPDPIAQKLLQDWFGYLLLPDTSLQKMLLMVGPPRSGKGTIQKVMTELIGASNVCAPSIKHLGTGFGIQPMIGKQIAFLSDIRIGKFSDGQAIAESLLRITGEDDVTADRKHKEAWTGRLAVRFVVSSNELPALADNSPALANRFCPLILEESHLGHEDHELANKLIAELPGILNWSLVGRRRLTERGSFDLPKVSQLAIEEILTLGSPVAAFVRDRCMIGSEHEVLKDVLFKEWKDWCAHNNHPPGRDNVFARSLMAATSAESCRPRAGVGARVNMYRGIALKDHGDEPY